MENNSIDEKNKNIMKESQPNLQTIQQNKSNDEVLLDKLLDPEFVASIGTFFLDNCHSFNLNDEVVDKI